MPTNYNIAKVDEAIVNESTTNDTMIVAKYKFDKSIYSNLIPVFNDGYSGYTVTDEIDSENSNHVIRTIECDSLPTLMRFGRVWTEGESDTDNRTDSLLKVLDMNTSELTSYNNMFRYNKNLTSINCNWDTSNVTNMYGMFYKCTNLTQLDVSNFDTSNVTNISNMFCYCNNLTSLDVSNWNTSKVNTMSNMFYNCHNLTSIDVSGFDTSEVTKINAMFYNCTKLTSLDVSNWNTSKVTDMISMFSACTKLTSLDVSNWNTSNVTSMRSMFANCNNLTQLNVSNWDTNEVTNMSQMFNSCNKLTSLDVSNFDTSNVTDMGGMFYECNNLTSLDVSGFNTSKVTNMINLFGKCRKIKQLNLANWNTSAVTAVNSLFEDCHSLELIDIKNLDITHPNKTVTTTNIFDECSKLIYIRCNNIETIEKLTTTRFYDRTNKESGILISDAKLSEETITALASKNWTVVTSDTLTKVAEYVYDSNTWRSMIPTFNDEFVDYFIDDVKDKNGLVTRTISSVEDKLPTLMRFGCFDKTAENDVLCLKELIYLDTSKVTDMNSMFTNCYNLTSLDVSNWNTSNVGSMYCMFYGCKNLTTLDVSNWNTSKVTNMNGMFSGCTNLTSLDVSNFDTNNVANMRAMFSGCTNLTSLDVSNWDTANVTNIQDIFNKCTNLTLLDVSNWNTSNVTNMQGVFYKCNNLTLLDVSNFNTSEVTIMQSMFQYCTNLISLDVSNFDTSKVTNITNMFADTPKLSDIGMLYCTLSTINTISSALPTTHTQTIWVQDTKPSECTVVSGVEFKEYKENSVVVNLNSPLLQGDRIEVKDGKLCHYHKMSMVTLDGSEPEFSSNIGYGWAGRINSNYAYEGSTNRSYRLKNAIIQTGYHFIVDNFKSVLGRNKKAVYYDGWGLYFFIPNEELQSLDAEGHRAYFRNNPTTVVYQLAEPYYEDITPLQSDITLETYLECNLDIYTDLPIKTNLTYLTNIANTSSIEEEINIINEGTDLTNLLEDEINN